MIGSRHESLVQRESPTFWGLAGAIAAYVFWGVMPLYWHLMAAVDAVDILAHRIVWSFVFIVMLLLLFRKSYSKLLEVFSDFFPHFTRVRAAFSKVGCIQLKPLEGQ